MSFLATALVAATLGLDLRLQPGLADPGDVVLFEVTGSQKAPLGQLGPEALIFLPFGQKWVALVGLSVDQQPTRFTIEIKTPSTDDQQSLQADLEISKANFRKRKLTVGKRFTSPSKKERQRTAQDQEAFAKAFDRDFEPWLFTQSFAWPRLAPITAPFGDLRLLNGKKQSQHYGADLGGDIGDAIVAANDGEVVLVRDCFASGNTVLIHHGGRLFSAYFHLSAFAVKEGEHVTQGQALGLVGKTGRVTGPHLHFGIKLDGRWVNPESLLRLEFSK